MRKTLLVLLLQVLLWPLQALGTDSFVAVNADGKDINYAINDAEAKTLTVIPLPEPAKYAGELNIPSTVEYNGQVYTVTLFDDIAFRNCKELTCLTIPETIVGKDGDFYLYSNCNITKIYYNAINAEGLYLPETVEEVVIGDAVEVIPYRFCSGCNNLKSVTMGSNVKKIGGSAFSDTGLTSLDIPASVEIIEGSAFYKSKLESIELPDNLNYIGSSAFQETLLKKITIPASVTELGGVVFKNCAELQEVTLNAHELTEVSKQNFVGCPKLTKFTASEGVTVIPKALFQDVASLETIDLPSTLTLIREGAFERCSALKSVSFAPGSQLSNIEWFAFHDCKMLESISFPETVKEIGRMAFRGCTSLTSLTIHEGIETLGINVFADCTSIHTINYNAINAIAGQAFEGCSAVENFNIGEKVTTISHNTCANVSPGPKELVVPASVKTLNNNSLAMPGVERVILNADCELCSYPFEGSASLKEVIVAEGVTCVSTSTFYSCPALEKVTFPSSLTLIGHMAFANCPKLAEVVIGENITEIGTRAFMNCKGLTKVEFNAEKCSVVGSTQYPTFAGAGVKTIVFGPKVGRVAAYAFAACTTITDITANSLTPPLCGTGAFDDVVKWDATLNVPEASLSDYKQANEWKDFVNIQGFTPPMPEAFEEMNQDGKLIGYKVVDAEKLYVHVVPLSEGVKYEGEVIVPATVEHQNLTYTVTGFSQTAFANCASLTALTIPEFVVDMDYTCFAGCENLRKVIYNAAAPTNADMLFRLCNRLNEIEIGEAVVNLPAALCNNLASLEVLTIGINVTTIGDAAFSATGLKSVTLPASVKTIGSSVFSNCASLASLRCEAVALESVGESFLAGCQALSSVEIAEGVTTIPDFMFAACPALTEIALPESLSELGASAFAGCKALRKVKLPSGLETINNRTFEGCTALADIPFPASLIEIDFNAFKGCSSLAAISFSDEFEMGISAFAECTGLTELKLPSALEGINSYNFQGCANLKNVEIGDKCTYVKQGAFSGCGNISQVTVTAPVPPAYEAEAFEASVVKSANLNVPEAAFEAYRNAEGWKDFLNISAISGIDAVSCDTKAGEPEYYTLDGIKLSSSPTAPGIYLRHIPGNSTEKIIIK